MLNSLYKALDSFMFYVGCHVKPLKRWETTKEATSSGLYFSMTTTPDRINKLKPTINSLLRQTEAPKGIFLNIPHKSRSGKSFNIPDFLLSHEKIIILRCEDEGPVTKLLPTLRYFSNRTESVPVVVLDDDQVYPKTLLETYARKSKNENQYAWTLCGWLAPKDLKHQSRNVLLGGGVKLTSPKANITEDTDVDILQGASSYLIETGFFNDAVFQLIKSAFYADDVWISGILAKQGVATKVAASDFPYIRITSLNFLFYGKTLKKTANRDNTHNDSLYHFFKDDWMSHN